MNSAELADETILGLVQLLAALTLEPEDLATFLPREEDSDVTEDWCESIRKDLKTSSPYREMLLEILFTYPFRTNTDAYSGLSLAHLLRHTSFEMVSRCLEDVSTMMRHDARQEAAKRLVASGDAGDQLRAALVQVGNTEATVDAVMKHFKGDVAFLIFKSYANHRPSHDDLKEELVIGDTRLRLGDPVMGVRPWVVCSGSGEHPAYATIDEDKMRYPLKTVDGLARHLCSVDGLVEWGSASPDERARYVRMAESLL